VKDRGRVVILYGLKLIYTVHNVRIPTSQRTYRLPLERSFGKCCRRYMEYVNVLCGQNVFLTLCYVQSSVVYSNHKTLKDQLPMFSDTVNKFITRSTSVFFRFCTFIERVTLNVEQIYFQFCVHLANSLV
jgi:hypothetical protein